MVRLKVSEVIAAYNTLQQLDLPAAIALKIARAARPIEAEARTYEQQRARLVQKYGEQQGGQTVVEPNSEKWMKFIAEVGELLNAEVDVEIVPLGQDILGNVRIAPGVLMPIWFLFED